jgi:signal transduction histidine kinase
MASFDADALAQIVGNLVDNAEKYTREASDRTITVRVADAPEGPEVRVSDRGPGLPASLRKKLFRPFARGAPRDGPAGLGLGLTLARALARAQGGEVVSASPGQGAELVVRLAR